MQLTLTPPKTGIKVNIAITGHRALPGADLGVLTGRIDEVLRYVRDEVTGMAAGLSPYHDGTAPVFRLLTMLAEGSDQLAARCALGLGYRLQCPLPMALERYEGTFSTDSGRQEMRRLLGLSERVFEISCACDVPARAFQNGGNVLLGHADIVLALWDGNDSGKVGGTFDVIESARRQDIPVLHIDAASPHGIRFIHGGTAGKHWREGVANVLKGLLVPGAGEKVGITELAEYFSEDAAVTGHAGLYRAAVSLLSGQRKKAGEEERYDAMPACLGAYYRCAGALAGRYGDVFRSAGVLRQLLPFLASIGLAVGFYASLLEGPLGAPGPVRQALGVLSACGLALQALCFVAIIVLSRVGKKRRWQQKFIDYRMLSELLRQFAYLWPAGLTVRGLSVPAYMSNVNVSWVNWYFRGIVREAGLPNAVLTAEGLSQCVLELRQGMLQSQILYHRNNTTIMCRVASKLEKAGIGIYYAGVAITAARAAVYMLTTGQPVVPLDEPGRQYLSRMFNMLSLVVPLFSSLAFGLSAQEGFDRIGMRSDAMLGRLAVFAGQMDGDADTDYNEFMKLTGQATDLILSEFTDWNAFIRTKPISSH